MWLPVVLKHPLDVLKRFQYSGAPGTGGLSLAVQPDLARYWLYVDPIHLSAASLALNRFGGALRFGSLAAVTGLLLVRPRNPLAARRGHLAAVAPWASISVNYVVWSMPFLIMSRMVAMTLVCQITVLLATIAVSTQWGAATRPHDAWALWVFVSSMLLLWAAMLLAWARQLWRLRAPQLVASPSP